jgi:hypothetical protein
MTKCVLCPEEIRPGTKAVSIAGGMFPREEPDLFMIDEEVLRESHAHLDCLLRVVKAAQQRERDTG